MENRIKECQLDLFADRTSANTMRANQLRLWFASMAYALICALRRVGLLREQSREADGCAQLPPSGLLRTSDIERPAKTIFGFLGRSAVAHQQ